MTPSQKDLIEFYNALPDWAREEFRELLQKVEHGEIADAGQLAMAVQHLVNRAEAVGDRSAFGRRLQE